MCTKRTFVCSSGLFCSVESFPLSLDHLCIWKKSSDTSILNEKVKYMYSTSGLFFFQRVCMWYREFVFFAWLIYIWKQSLSVFISTLVKNLNGVFIKESFQLLTHFFDVVRCQQLYHRDLWKEKRSKTKFWYESKIGNCNPLTMLSPKNKFSV